MPNLSNMLCYEAPGGQRRPKALVYSLGCCSGLIVAIILIAVSLKKLSSTQLGVEYDTWSKQLDDAAKQGGLHNGPPGFRFIKFPSTQITAEIRDTCVSRDGLRVQFHVSYQYLMPETWIIPAVKQYRDFQKWSTIVEAAGNSAIQNSCSTYTITSFQSLRNLIQLDMFDELKLKLEGTKNATIENHDGVYAKAIALQLKNVQLPSEYTAAVSDKQSAKEDIILATNQRNQELTKARTLLLAAKQEEEKIKAKATNDANVALTEAGLKAQQTTFAFSEETATIKQAIENFNLDTNGVLSYLANQLYARAPTLKAAIREPAKISLRDDL